MRGTIRTLLIGIGGLIALYLIAENSGGVSSDISSATGGAAGVITALQGRPGK